MRKLGENRNKTKKKLNQKDRSTFLLFNKINNWPSSNILDLDHSMLLPWEFDLTFMKKYLIQILWKLRFTKKPRNNMINSMNKDKISSGLFMIKDQHQALTKKNLNNLNKTLKRNKKISLSLNYSNMSMFWENLLSVSILLVKIEKLMKNNVLIAKILSKFWGTIGKIRNGSYFKKILTHS
jgi:hypothetical protein